MAQTPALSLIVGTLGRTECLARLLVSLQQQTCPDFEVLLIDQNPPGFLDALLLKEKKELRLRRLVSPPGLSRARNVGIAQAEGTWLAFPDDDAWYAPDLVEKFLALAKEGSADIITCATRDEHGNVSNGRFLTKEAPLSPANIWRAGNSNGVFVRRAFARQIGGFDETLGVGSGTPFGSGEETDFLLRALWSGGQGVFTTRLSVHHDQVDLLLDDKALARAALYATGFGRVLRLHHFSFSYMFYRAARSTLAAFFYRLTGHRRMAAYKWIWARGTWSGYHAPVHAKKEDPSPE